MGTRRISNRGGEDHDRTLRRTAIQIVLQLPDDRADAETVLRYAQQLLEEFVERPDASPRERTGGRR
jgi:hypothetical protein